MELKEIGLKIESLIREQHKNKTKFAKEYGLCKNSTNKTLKNIIFSEKGANYITLENILNKLGYELVVQKKESQWKSI